MLNATDTDTSNLDDLTTFVQVYEEPIRAAVATLGLIRRDEVDDVVQSFLLKVHAKDLLQRYREHVHSGRATSFRGWLYAALRNDARDVARHESRRPEAIGVPDGSDAADWSAGESDDIPDDDLLYALSFLHMAVQRVRKHWEECEKPEDWTCFEEVYLRPIQATPPSAGDAADMPRRRLRTDAERVEEQKRYNRATSVRRVFERILPSVIPAELCDRDSPEERFREWADILLRSSAVGRVPIWVAFLRVPRPVTDATTFSSSQLARPQVAAVAAPGSASQPEGMEPDELRVLLSFWLSLPLGDYLGDLAGFGPATLAGGIMGTGHHPRLSLRTIVNGGLPDVPRVDLEALLRRVKHFAKQVYHAARAETEANDPPAAPRRAHSIPSEVALALYNLAAALAVTQCGRRIDSLATDHLRENFASLVRCPWLTRDLAPVLLAAIEQLDSRSAEAGPG